ncbi:hypothetical protein [Dyella humicola]|uniref:hypothetical protein n=1 Tax=Dyella humicola TaxID=2992126 RepID=UPI002257B73A|nr:hypothetical protein [Dyella humicola]
MLALVLLVTTLVYWLGLHGGWLFDDYPNIVDNKGVQPEEANASSLINAAFSSPSSEFKRPIASLSFAANFLLSGLDPFWMKLTNLLIHLINGVLVFVLIRALLQCTGRTSGFANPLRKQSSTDTPADQDNTEPNSRPTMLALWITAAWLLLPINLTAVLYVVQRMESLANLFILLGLIGYVQGRRRMLGGTDGQLFSRGFLLCLASLTLPTAIGTMAKETAVMLPLYALLVEWCLFDFRGPASDSTSGRTGVKDRRLVTMFLMILVLPLLIGLGYLLPGLLQPKAWSTRDFTMTTRLLSEARVVVDYIRWTIFPTARGLSFYHDDFDVSDGLLTPWTTIASIACLVGLSVAAIWLRRRRPLAALGIALFLASHLLTGTILPLELIYEHRNYFASLGLLLAVLPSIVPRSMTLSGSGATVAGSPDALERRHLVGRLRHGLSLLPLLLLMGWWLWLTTMTAYAWGDPLRLARELATRAPESPRAQYELGRTYIIYSRYDPNSEFTRLAYAPLEQAASLPKSSILPQQALIFMNARMHLPIKDTWWDSMIAKLRSRKPGVQDESSLIALVHCMHEAQCDLPKSRMSAAFQAAISHPDPSARILAAYGEFAWNELSDAGLGEKMMTAATKVAPSEAAYRITLFHMYVSEKKFDEARRQLGNLQDLNMGGYLDKELAGLRDLLPSSDNSN